MVLGADIQQVRMSGLSRRLGHRVVWGPPFFISHWLPAAVCPRRTADDGQVGARSLLCEKPIPVSWNWAGCCVCACVSTHVLFYPSNMKINIFFKADSSHTATVLD